jgi:hypothetical protein
MHLFVIARRYLKASSMTKTEIELTDPSRELGQLAEYLRNFPAAANSEHTHVALARAIGTNNDTADYLDVTAEAAARIQRLLEFAREIKDPDIDQELRQDVISAATAFGHLFAPSHSTMLWNDMKQRFIQDSHVRILKWFGPTAKRYRPLRVIKPEEVRTTLGKLTEIIKEIESGEPHWSNAPLINGLQRLQRILKHLNFLGHEAAIDQILLFSQRATAIQEAIERERTTPEQRPTSIFKVLNAIAVVGALFCLPAQAVDAVDRYGDWGLRHAIELLESHFEQRLLPAPEKRTTRDDEKAILTERNERNCNGLKEQ